MSDFLDSEAEEESGEELEETRDQDEKGDDEDEEDEEMDENEVNDIIDDNPIEEDEEESADESPVGRKRKLESDDDEEIDDDDLDLIQENTGIKIKKKKHSRVKLLDSDDDEIDNDPVNDRDQIAQDIFDQDDNDDDVQSTRSARSQSRQSERYTAIENVGEESDEGEEGIDDFIVDDDDQPINVKKTKKKSSSSGQYTDSALQEAQDIFGLEFDLSEFDADAGEEDGDDEDDDDLDEETLTTRAQQRKARRKTGKKSIYQVYEPAELEKGHMTINDNKIKVTDVPERFQLRSVPVQPAVESELDEEAEWIYKQAFMEMPISQQNFQDPVDANKTHVGFEAKPVTAIPRIRAALSFMKKDLFEVPFISMYRKEYIEPELKRDDLWKVYHWDEKYTQFMMRRKNMKRLFQEIQTYQFEMTRNDPDVSIKPGFRLLEQEDIDRLDNAQSMDELMDLYSHFQMYYGNDVIDMKEWKEKNKSAPKKKTKLKTIRVKKKKEKKQKESSEKENEGGVGSESTKQIDPETGEPVAEKDGEEAKNKEDGGEKSQENSEDKDKEGDDEKESDESSKKKDDGGESNKTEESGIKGGVGVDIDDDEESEYEEQQIEVTDSEAEEEEPEEITALEAKRKLPRRRDLYTICKDNGLLPMVQHFGLTAEQFGENVRDNYQRHETEQHAVEPLEAAKEYINNTFPSAEAILSGARHALAFQISRDPLVKQSVRQVFFERAKIYITPTKKGKKEIDEFHPAAPFKYLKSKPVRDLHGEQFLKMFHAEQEKLVKIKLAIDNDTANQGLSYLDEIKQLYYRDEYSNLVQEWNKQRAEVLSMTLNSILYPQLAKELKSKLLRESVEFALMLCTMKLRNWIGVRPYLPESYNEEGGYSGDNENTHCRVLSCSFSSDANEASFLAMLDNDGQVVDFLRLKYLMWRRNSKKESERQKKESDMERLKAFITKHQPLVVAVAAESRESVAVAEDISRVLQELEQEEQRSHVYVELVDAEVARIYQDSPRAQHEFPEYPSLLRHAISIGRRIQDPLLEFASLCDTEEELLCLRFSQLQELLPKDLLMKRLETEFISQVNEVGVDISSALEFPHTAVLTQFLCGLGPRKAGHLLKTIRQHGSKLDNRSQLVTVCEMGLQVFLNCAGFIRIEPSEANDKYEVLDGTRIHPETYDWPRKMAVDALEYDEGMEENNPSSAVEEILEQPDRLKDLDLDAFAEELARQGYGNKQITLYDIRDELINRFKDHRPPYNGLTTEERFRLLTGETQQSLFYGKMVTCIVNGFAFKKATREELDSANPTRNDETNLWKCPFCLKDTFMDLSEVWTHFDNGSCPGQAVGVRTRLDNGISGFISNKNISDKGVRRPEERVQIGMTLHARVIKINFDRFQVDLTCKTSDLTDSHGKFTSPKDLYYDQENSDKDKKHEENLKQAQAKRTTYLKRVIAHPSFKNVTFKDAEKLLENMDLGDSIVRPSSKGCDHLTVTWKIASNTFQHIDIREEGKENDFSIGKSLWIENEEYEDLDEIMARHISPMAAHAREISTHKYHRETDGTKAKLEEVLTMEKRKTPGRIPYFFSCSKQFPGKFMLGYMPRNKPRVEYVSITPDGFRYRGRVHATTNNLLKWFKEHFRDPVPGAGTPGSHRRSHYGHTPSGRDMSGTTPYTPGGTPSNLITDDEANSLIQQYGSTPSSRSTPGGYSTPGFTPSGTTPRANFGGNHRQWGTPSEQNYPQNNRQHSNNHRGRSRHRR